MNAAFSGRKRSGKTTLAFDMAMKAGGGILIFDPKREFRGWPGSTSDVTKIKEIIDTETDIIVFHPDGDTREEFEKLADLVLELHKVAMAKGWDKTGEHFTFIVDEAVNVSTQNFVSPKLEQLLAQNRPEILNIYLTFQDPKDVNNRLKSRIDTWFIFNTSLPANLEYLNRIVGVPETDLAEIKDLRPHEYAHFFFDGGEPKVEYDYSPDEWFRPLEFFELNSEEREEYETMVRRDNDDMQDLFEDFLDWMDERSEDRDRDRDRNRSRGSSRDRDRDRDRDRNRSGRRDFQLNR